MALSNIYIYNYNNYFNRKVKKETSLSNYGTPIYTLTNTNFNPGDGVITEHILGTSEYSGKGDYLIETDLENNIISRWFIIEADRTKTGQYKVTLKRDVIVDNYNAITSAPCFIKRAMVSENNPLILNSEGMSYNQIKKEEVLLKDESATSWVVGYINKKSLNLFETKYIISAASGNHTFNNIDSVDSVIVHSNDTSGNSYDVDLNYKGTYDTYGYTWNPSTHVLTWDIAQTLMTTSYLLIQAGGKKTITTVTYEEPSDYIDAEDLPWEFDPSSTALGTLDGDLSVDFFAWNKVTSTTGRQVSFGALLERYSTGIWSTSTGSSVWATAGTVQTADNSALYPMYSTEYDISSGNNLNSFKLGVLVAFMTQPLAIAINDTDVDRIFKAGGLAYCSVDPSSYNGKVIKYNGAYYDITIGSNHRDYHTYEFGQSSDSVDGLYTKVHNIYRRIATGNSDSNVTWTEQSGTNASLNAFRGSFYSNSYPITITRHPLTSKDTTLTIPAQGFRNPTKDAPYDIFAIPYDKVTLQTATVQTDPDITSKLVQELPLQLGSQLYDIQLLPYCPIRDIIVSSGVLKELGTEGQEYTYIKSSDGSVKNIVYFCSSSKSTFDINVNLSIEQHTTNQSINKKIDSETVFYRLVSPNYNGQFEFKVSHNNADITKINVDLEYKPYIPYIHLSPVWNVNGLYGGDYDDARGLICGGDFSLPVVNDAWTQYQIQNKNYQNIFDRQIQNLETNYELQQSMKNDQAIIGMFTSTIGGAAAGAKMGGPVGALAGTVIGAAVGGLGMAGRALDASYSNKQLAEQESYSKDSFRYQLQNIQALPYSISKVSAFNNNNKIFPFIEQYTATDEEVQALINKITYTSMELGVVDIISNYINPTNKYFLSGDILILDTINDDTHVINSIFEEIKRGVYI